MLFGYQHYSKESSLCSAEKRNSYRVRVTWASKRKNDNEIILFWVNIQFWSLCETVYGFSVVLGSSAGTFIQMNVEGNGFKSYTNEMSCPSMVDSSVSNMILSTTAQWINVTLGHFGWSANFQSTDSVEQKCVCHLV